MKLSERLFEAIGKGSFFDDAVLAEVAHLEAELAAHKENEGDECPLCRLEAENEELKARLREIICLECEKDCLECECD